MNTNLMGDDNVRSFVIYWSSMILFEVSSYSTENEA